jgi:hypothetical protein
MTIARLIEIEVRGRVMNYSPDPSAGMRAVKPYRVAGIRDVVKSNSNVDVEAPGFILAAPIASLKINNLHAVSAIADETVSLLPKTHFLHHCLVQITEESGCDLAHL